MEPLFFTSGYAVVFWVAFYAWVIPEILLSWARRSPATAVRRDRGSKFVLIGLILAGCVLGFWSASLLPGATMRTFRPAIFAVGVAVIFLGMAIRYWAILTLGRFFTTDVAVRTDQRVVERGPYRYVRHPSYSGKLVVLLGVGLAMTNWVSLAAVVLLGLLGHLYRVEVEERLLKAELGRPYEEYAGRTRRFVPFAF